MKKTLFTIITLIAVSLLASCMFPHGESSSGTGTHGESGDGNSGSGSENIVEYGINDEVRACFNLVNEFRTGDEAFYLNKDNTTTTSLVGQLEELTLDEGLCRAAQIRAKEIVSNFSHTRPDGTSCSTVFAECSLSFGAKGENIAAGTASSTGRAAFTQWKEDNEDFDGQGHRRNMLGNFTHIGIAYVYAPSSRYKYYWAMVLGR